MCWFQSTPFAAEGRSVSEAILHAVRRSFNPRPSLPKGEAGGRRVWALSDAVSIHALRCRRAKPLPTRNGRSCKLFQSTPFAAEGRSGARRQRHADFQVVSIHALRCRRAKRTSARPTLPLGWFQSTPFAAEGRSLRKVLGVLHRYLVSIHALRCRRAKRAADDIQAVLLKGFNPRPSLPKGEACRRAVVSRRAWTGFNPRPSLPKGEACCREETGPARARFNPRPSLPKGEAAVGLFDGAAHWRFNPRPSLPKGEAGHGGPFGCG